MRLDEAAKEIGSNYFPFPKPNRQGTTLWSNGLVSVDSLKFPTGAIGSGSGVINLNTPGVTQDLTTSPRFSINKSAGNQQGHGQRSPLIRIDRKLQGNVIRFSMWYYFQSITGGSLVLDGTTANHDIRIAIYDVTNSAWIQPSGCYLGINSLTKSKVVGEFQCPINSTQFYVYIYQATTSAVAWNMDVDDIFFGDSPRVIGSLGLIPMITRYTTSGAATHTTNKATQYMIVKMVGGGGGGGGGSTLATLATAGQAGGNTTFGTSLLTAAGGNGGGPGPLAGVSIGGAPTVNSPAIDFGSSQGGNGHGTPDYQTGHYYGGGAGGVSKYSSAGANTINSAGPNGPSNSGAGGAGGGANPSGTGGGGGGGAAGAYVEAMIKTPAASYSVNVGAGGLGGAAQNIANSFNGGNGADGIVEVIEYIPTNSVQLSSDATTRRVNFSAYMTNSVSVPNLTATKLDLSSVTEDSHGSFDVANKEWLILVPGSYRFTYRLEAQAYGGASDVQHYLAKNGTPVRTLMRGSSTQFSTIEFPMSARLDNLKAGDRISIMVIHNAGVNVTVGAAGRSGWFFEGERISDPVTIAATETISLHATNTSGLSCGNGSNTLITGWTKVDDSHNLLTASTGEITIQTPGRYQFDMNLSIDTVAGMALAAMWAVMYVDGSAVLLGPPVTPVGAVYGGGNSQVGVGFTCTRPFLAGQKVRPAIFQSSGGSRTLTALGGYNHMSFKRVGNL